MARERTLRELIEITREAIRAFDAVERRPWSVEAALIELTKQTGDLARRVMAAEGYYLADRERREEYGSSAAEIGDELADILYCLIRVADHYGIDLEEAHLRARRAELGYLGREAAF